MLENVLTVAVNPAIVTVGWLVKPEPLMVAVAPSTSTDGENDVIANVLETTVTTAWPCLPPEVAVMVAWPSATPVTCPALLTDAIDGALDDQLTVPSVIVAPFWSRPVAAAVVDDPTPIVLDPKVTDTVVRTGVGDVGVEEPLLPFELLTPQPQTSARQANAERCGFHHEVRRVLF